MPPGITNPDKAAEIREELRKLFSTATPQAKKRLLSIIVERIIVCGKDITMHGKTSGIIAVSRWARYRGKTIRQGS